MITVKQSKMSNNYYPKLIRFGLTLNKLSESVQIFLALKVQIGLKTYTRPI